jgi:hypothetical protein
MKLSPDGTFTLNYQITTVNLFMKDASSIPYAIGTEFIIYLSLLLLPVLSYSSATVWPAIRPSVQAIP